MCAAAAASAFVSRRCLFGGAAVWPSAVDPSRLKSSCGWGWGRRYLSQSLANPDRNPPNKILPQIQIQIQIQKQKRKVPWLMLSSATKPESRYFYDLLSRGAGGAQDGDDGMPLISLNREIDLPQIAGHRCIGSSQGFLITVDRNAEIHATNPITGGSLPLPSTATLPNMIGYIRDQATGDIKYYISSKDKDTTDSPEITILFNQKNAGRDSLLLSLNNGTIDSYDVEYMRRAYYGKLILSPSLDIAVAYHLANQGCGRGRLAFARLGGGDGTSSWTDLPSGEDHVDHVNDIILHKGQLHAIDYAGTLSVYDMENPSAHPFCSPEGPLLAEDVTFKRSLVESADGDDLFLVFKDLGDDERTQGFKVFKLDKTDYKWNQVDSVGDLALFVGFHHNISLSARAFHGLKPNCIYFKDDYPDAYLHFPQVVLGDTGVYNLKDGSIQFIQFFQLADGLQELNWPPPVWFMPAMR